MKKCNQPPINDINCCLKDAHCLVHRINHIRRSDLVLFSAFTSLAGDKVTGLLAYIIWRSRSRLISRLRCED
jgi:hypothetical protein